MSGAYAASFSFGKEKKFSDSKQSLVNLGPGSYADIDIKKVGSKAPNYSFGKQKRPQTSAANLATPGPGSYSHADFKKHNSPKFSVAKNKRSMDLMMTGGGSQYLKSPLEQNSASLGPGNYELDTSYSKVKPRIRSVVSQKSERSMDFSKKNKVPGPGSYEGDVKIIKSSVPKYSIGKQSKVDPMITHREKQLIPGPGVYEVSTTIGTGLKVYLCFNFYSFS